MARRDPLAVLARVRGIARDVARRDLADAQAVLGAADAARAAALDAMRSEAVGSAPADYAAWLPAAKQAEAQATSRVGHAAAAAEVARAALVAARAAAEAVETLLDARRVAARRARLAAEQAVLDDCVRG